MKLAIVGSRTFKDYECLERTILSLISLEEIELIISGGAMGADSLAERFAKKHNIETLVFLPDWDLFGKKAGFIRNEKIIKSCDEVIAFWDGMSKGTKSSVDLAKQYNKKILVKMISFCEEELDNTSNL